MAWLILYGLSIALSKCAILLLYVRVFTTSNKFFTSSVCLMGFVIIATGAANTFVAIFQCSPVAYEWNKSIQGGKCIDQVAFARYMAIPNVVTGAIMLAMPLPLSWKLNLTTSARIALTATFMHGIMYANQPDTEPTTSKETWLTTKQRIHRKLRSPKYLLPHRRIHLHQQ